MIIEGNFKKTFKFYGRNFPDLLNINCQIEMPLLLQWLYLKYLKNNLRKSSPE